ncbi:MAG: hypothetical protein IT480_02605 [Gammaproteobacteria bacterium]|nr:hypothetical protein [Gammaproteobacteria bacterium]
MRLVLDSDPKIHTIRRYGPGEIVVGAQVLHGACIVSATRLVAPWAAQSPSTLDEAQLAPLLELRPSVILLGAGAGELPAPRPLVMLLQRRGIGVESMGLGAACRTYNVLVHEGRAVVAGLFPF